MDTSTTTTWYSAGAVYDTSTLLAILPVQCFWMMMMMMEREALFGIMKEAYCILPQREDFCSPEGWTPKKLKMCTTMYLSAPVKHCFSRIGMQSCSFQN